MKAREAANLENLLHHAGWLRRLAVALVKDPDVAEDIVQETLVSAWQNPTESGERPWLARVARNLAINRWRSSHRRQQRELGSTLAHADPVASPEKLIGNAEIHRALAEAVAELEEPFRQTVVRRYFDGSSSAEIARGLDIPEGTVRWRLKEGIERLRRHLDARHGQSREGWVAALLPLLPRPPSPGSLGESAPPPTGSATHSRLGLRSRAMAVALASMAGMALMLAALFSHRDDVRLPASATGHEPEPAHAIAPRRGKDQRVLLNPAWLAAAPEPAAQPNGPGPFDAQSLVRELLEAIEADSFDDFSAKGAPEFKAGGTAERFHERFKDAVPRLASGYEIVFLGQLRRANHTTLWLFRLELHDGSEDVLIQMLTDGWQILRFYAFEPKQEEE